MSEWNLSDELNKIFDHVDTNGNGTIEREEMAKAIEQHAREDENPFADLDLNSDGKVTREEW